MLGNLVGHSLLNPFRLLGGYLFDDRVDLSGENKCRSKERVGGGKTGWKIGWSEAKTGRTDALINTVTALCGDISYQ